MVSMRKAKRRYWAWEQWYSKLDPECVTTPGWERAWNRWALLWNRGGQGH
jgi:hypothetical protein